VSFDGYDVQYMHVGTCYLMSVFTCLNICLLNMMYSRRSTIGKMSYILPAVFFLYQILISQMVQRRPVKSTGLPIIIVS